jgi:hypothetical protein
LSPTAAGAEPAIVAEIMAQQPQLLLRSPSKLVERLRLLDELLGLGSPRTAAAVMASDAGLAGVDLDSIRGVRGAVLAELREVYRQQAVEGEGEGERQRQGQGGQES